MLWCAWSTVSMGVLLGAIARCRPEAQSEALAVERALVARFNTLVTAERVTGTLVGQYPRTRLTAHNASGERVPGFDWSIWPGYEPSTYPLEHATGFRVTLLDLEGG